MKCVTFVYGNAFSIGYSLTIEPKCDKWGHGKADSIEYSWVWEESILSCLSSIHVGLTCCLWLLLEVLLSLLVAWVDITSLFYIFGSASFYGGTFFSWRLTSGKEIDPRTDQVPVRINLEQRWRRAAEIIFLRRKMLSPISVCIITFLVVVHICPTKWKFAKNSQLP